MDWTTCIICRNRKVEPLKYPIESLKKDCGLEVYTDFLENVKIFKELDALPINVDFGEAVTPELLAENRASWHKSCFRNQNLNVQQRKGNVMIPKMKPQPELRGSW